MKRWVVLSLFVAMGFTVAACFSIEALIPQIPLVWPVLVGAGIILLLLLIALTFRRLSIVATDSHLSFGFGPFRKRLPWNEIRNVSPEPYLFTRFIGWGIRWDGRDTFAFAAQSGMGIEIQTRKRWRYFVTTDQPQTLIELARERLRQSRQQ